MSTAQPDRDPTRDASVVVARDADGLVALLSAHFPAHQGDFLFLPGGRKEPGETYEECARRELREESGITAKAWRPLGTYALSVSSPALRPPLRGPQPDLRPPTTHPHRTGLQTHLVAHGQSPGRRHTRPVPPPRRPAGALPGGQGCRPVEWGPAGPDRLNKEFSAMTHVDLPPSTSAAACTETACCQGRVVVAGGGSSAERLGAVFDAVDRWLLGLGLGPRRR